jgi:hypothetical protein
VETHDALVSAYVIGPERTAALCKAPDSIEIEAIFAPAIPATPVAYDGHQMFESELVRRGRAEFRSLNCATSKELGGRSLRRSRLKVFKNLLVEGRTEEEPTPGNQIDLCVMQLSKEIVFDRRHNDVSDKFAYPQVSYLCF